MSALIEKLRLPLYFIGLLAIFLGERHFNTSSYREILLGLGVAALLVSTILAFLRARIARFMQWAGEERSWYYLTAWQSGGILSVVLYFAYSLSLDTALIPSSVMQKALLASMLLSMFLTASSAFGLEWAHRQSGQGPWSDHRQVCRVGGQWLLVGMLLSILFSLNYAASEKDQSSDLSYLKMSQAGSSTRSMIRTLKAPLQVVLYFSERSTVLNYVDGYFTDLQNLSEYLDVQIRDVDLHPADAEKHKVSRNGLVLVGRDGEFQRIDVRDQIAEARDRLRKFDGEFQRILNQLLTEAKVAYFSRGHGEMTWTASQQSGFRSLRFVERLMKTQQYRVKTWDRGQGSGQGVPGDATLVVIAGPTRPFMQDEVDALRSYLERGGKLLVLLDVSSGELDRFELIRGDNNPLLALLDEMGIGFESNVLANESKHVSVRKTPSDRWFLFSNVFTSHESVTNLAKHEERVPVLFFQSGYLRVQTQKGEWKTFETIRSLDDSFVDLNRNYRFDPEQEKKGSYTIGAAAVLTQTQRSSGESPEEDGDLHGRGTNESRVVVLADATAVSDGIIATGVPGNQLLVADSLRWLADESEYSGDVLSEEDVRIRHNQDEDRLLFYATIFAFPALILIAGYVATRRRKRGGDR